MKDPGKRRRSIFRRRFGALGAAVIALSAGVATAPTSGQSAAADPGPAPMPQIVVDNDDPGFSRHGFDTLSRAGNRDHYDDDYLHSGDPATVGDQWARWTPTIEEAGTYKVFIRWNSFSNRPTAAPVAVTSRGGEDTWTTTINQRINSVNWYHLGDFELAEGTGNHVQLTDAGGAYTVADAVKFVKVSPDDSASPDYVDDFQGEQTGSDPSHWVESNLHNDWKVGRDGRNTVYRHQTQETRSAVSWLHVFEQDVDVTAKVMVKDHADTGARVGLPVRYNTAESQIFAGYDFDTRTWQIAERRGVDSDWKILAQSPQQTLTRNTWHMVRVTTHNGEVALYVGDLDTPKVSTDIAAHRSPGRVALDATGTEALFDDVEVTLLTDQGRVEDGVLDYTLNDGDGVYREGATVVELANSDIMIRVWGELFRSTDDGATFDEVVDHDWPANPYSHHSIIRLQSGKLLNMISEVQEPPPGGDPPNRFRAWTSDDEGETWEPRGLTWEEYREGAPDRAQSIVMNDKLTQASTGRIFYAVTFRRVVDGAIRGHYMEVHYSDDEGETWSKSQGNSDDWTGIAGFQFAEGKIIEAADGTLRLYMPYSDLKGITQTVSTDGGVTWSGAELTPGVFNARSSLGITKSPDAENPVYYMVWAFNDEGDYAPGAQPRSRLALATSTDGINWEYAMDLDRWVSARSPSTYHPIVQFVDPGITVTDDYVYVTSGRSDSIDPEDPSHNAQRLRVYRVDRDAIDPYESWPAEY